MNILIVFIFLFKVGRVNLWGKLDVMVVRELFIFLKGFQCKFTNLPFLKKYLNNEIRGKVCRIICGENLFRFVSNVMIVRDFFIFLKSS